MHFKFRLMFLLFMFCVSANSLAQNSSANAFELYKDVISGKTPVEELTPEQRMQVFRIHQALSSANSSEEIEGHNFSLRDIERKCEVYKYDESYGELECRGSDLRPVERKCEVYFYDNQNGEIECRGSDFRPIERKCSVSLYDEEYGEIDC